VAALLRGVSLLSLVCFILLLFRSLETGVNAKSEISLLFLLGHGLLLTYPSISFMMLSRYTMVIYPSAVMNLLIASNLILISLLTGFVGGFLWRVSQVAEEFGEAKEKFLSVLAKWKKEKPVRFTVGIVSSVASYILAVLVIQFFILPDLGYYLFGFVQSSMSQQIALLSFPLLVLTGILHFWFEISIASDALYP